MRHAGISRLLAAKQAAPLLLCCAVLCCAVRWAACSARKRGSRCALAVGHRVATKPPACRSFLLSILPPAALSTRSAAKRVFLLDHDGTLVAQNSISAKPSQEVLT